MKSESIFRKKVVSFLRTLPFCKIFSIQQKAITGHPDLIICLDGKFIALEIKTDDGHPSARQVLTLEDVIKAKGTALIVRPSNLEEIKEILQKISKGIRYDSNEISGLTTPKPTANSRKSGKHSDGTSKKLRDQQASLRSESRDQENSGGEWCDPQDFREI